MKAVTDPATGKVTIRVNTSDEGWAEGEEQSAEGGFLVPGGLPTLAATFGSREKQDYRIHNRDKFEETIRKIVEEEQFVSTPIILIGHTEKAAVNAYKSWFEDSGVAYGVHTIIVDKDNVIHQLSLLSSLPDPLGVKLVVMALSGATKEEEDNVIGWANGKPFFSADYVMLYDTGEWQYIY